MLLRQLNLLCEFKIAEKNDAIQTNIKKGKVILVKEIASSILSKSLINPGAIIKLTKKGIKTSIQNQKKQT